MASEFLNRWSRRKLNPEAEIEESVQQELQEPKASEAVAEPESTESQEVDGNEDDEQYKDLSVAQLLTTTAAASVKKAALRKLFLSGEFSAVDNLNDYDHDYASVGKLGAEVAEKLRDWVKDVEEEPEEVIAEQETNEEHESLEAEENEQQESDEIVADRDSEDRDESAGETKYPT